MQAFLIEEPHIKGFMQHLFTLETFVDFEVRGVIVHCFTQFEISGEKGAQDEQGSTYCTWGELRPYVRNIIKGKEKPRAMKIIFARGAPESLHPNAAALFVNVNYDTDKITCTTACSQKNFELNKAVDLEWDRWVAGFFKEAGILTT